jgi:hypothetical protein
MDCWALWGGYNKFGTKDLVCTKSLVSCAAKDLTMDKKDNQSLVEWFSTHPLFSINGMCKMVKVDTANFSRYLSSGKIPEKYITKIKSIIKDYGYNETMP